MLHNDHLKETDALILKQIPSTNSLSQWLEISRLENLSGDIGITGVNWDRNDFQHSVVLIAAAGLQLCVCFVGYRGKKNRMYQQETTIRQRVIQCELFYNQVAVIFCESFNVVYQRDFVFCVNLA